MLFPCRALGGVGCPQRALGGVVGAHDLEASLISDLGVLPFQSAPGGLSIATLKQYDSQIRQQCEKAHQGIDTSLLLRRVRWRLMYQG